MKVSQSQKLPYLTKNSETLQFQEHLEQRLEVIEKALGEVQTSIKEEKKKLRELDEQEEQIRGDDKKMISFFKKRRELKDGLKKSQENLKALTEQKTKLSHQIGGMKNWDMMFKSLKIDVVATKKKQEDKKSEDQLMQLHVNQQKVSGVKRGIQFITPSSTPRINYGVLEKKYDAKHLFELNLQHKRDLELRRNAVSEKVKSKLKSDTQRINNISKSRLYSSYFYDVEPSVSAVLNTSVMHTEAN